MRALIGSMLVAILLLTTAEATEDLRQSSPPKLEVYLATDRNHYKAGETIRVRVEIKNSGRDAVLVGRDLSIIANWPFSIWLRLVDSHGKYAQPVDAGFVDPPPRADLSAREGVLRWWITLDPGSFYGKYVDFQLESVGTGQYRLEGDYYSTGLNAAPATTAPGVEQTRAFTGTIQAHPAIIEVDPAG